MSSDGVKQSELTVAFVLEAKQLQQSLALRVLEQFPNAQVFVGPALKYSTAGIMGFLVSVERRLFRYPGRLSPPLELQALPDVPPMIDIIIDLRPGGPDKALLQSARDDLWWLNTVGTAAVLSGESSVQISIIGQSDAQKDARLIARACIQSKVMIARTQDFALEKSLQLIRRELARIGLTGETPDLGPVPKTDTPVRAGAVPGYLTRVFFRLASAFMAQLNNGWELRHPFALRSGMGAPGRFASEHGRVTKHPDQGWFADPFLIEQNGKIFCFFEDLPRGSKKAGISVARMVGDRFEILGRAVGADYHLSYPYVFKHDGEIYMIPETLGAHRIEIWKAIDFPKGWQLYATALEGQKFADPVLVEIGTEWWLFANPSNDSLGDFSSELWLFRVDGPELRQIEPHPLNPVVVGSDTARGGGRVIWHDNRLLRFSQDNSGSIYGYGLNVMEITRITSTDYQEERIQHISPEQIPGVIGCHHVDFLNGRFVMDVRLP